MKRIFTILLVLLILVGGIAGCAQPAPSMDEQPQEEEPLVSNPAEGENAAPAHDIAIVAGGETQFVLVRPESAGAVVKGAAVTLQEAIAETTGVTLAIEDDLAASSGNDHFEILVGTTDRPASAMLMASFTGAAEYAVLFQDNKLVISGQTEDGLIAAVNDFVAVVSQNGKQGELTFASDFVIRTQMTNPALEALPVFTFAEVKGTRNCGDDATMMTFESDAEGFAACLEELKQAGFTEYARNQIGDNLFATYTNNHATASVMYIPSLSSVRLVTEPVGTLPAVSPETVSAVTTPQVTMLGLEGYDTSGSPNQIGMSFLYRLSDGSFLVIDGGHNQELPAQQLYDQMVAQAPDPNTIVIAAWIFTHAHPDHSGTFTMFTSMFADKVDIELIVHNMPADTQFITSDNPIRYRTNLISASQAYTVRGAKMMKTHPGQVLYIRDAVVEVFYTHEMQPAGDIAYFNETSLIFTVNLAGQKTMILGDCAPITSPIVTAAYGTSLKSDIVQVAHHGYQGATPELYQMIDAEYALWPGGSKAYENYHEQDYNIALLTGKSLKYWVLAEDKITVWQLPFAGDGQSYTDEEAVVVETAE